LDYGIRFGEGAQGVTDILAKLGFDNIPSSNRLVRSVRSCRKSGERTAVLERRKHVRRHRIFRRNRRRAGIVGDAISGALF
jgi:hypothetical protein